MLYNETCEYEYIRLRDIFIMYNDFEMGFVE